MERHDSGTRRDTRKGSRRDGEGLWDWNLASNRIHFSPGWISLVGCQDHEVGNTPDDWFLRVHPEDSDRLLRDIDTARAARAADFELRYRMRHKDGTYRWMWSRGLVVRNDAGDAIRLTGSQSDVTVETVTDRQTGLPNRLLLLDRLTQSIERARWHPAFHFALLLIDIGRPASASGKSAPTAADPLLSAAARRLESCLRNVDMLPDLRQTDVVARVNGDWLAVLLDGVKHLNHAKTVADRLLVEMLNPLTVSGRDVRLSPSIGVAVSASTYSDANQALRDAETALHRARVLGGSHCEVFDAEVLRSHQADQELERDFESALQRREFELHYQPVVSIASNQVVGFEALVRWQHPVRGLIPPLDFIPLAERTGFIARLGHWILQDACARLSSWQGQVPHAKDLWVSVNLSAVQLRDPNLVERIDEVLRASQLSARSLVLELTEGTAMDNPAAVTTVLMRLRAMGVRISIDDFGTGYSSLAYLRQFPVDTLKIDRSFIRSLAVDKDTAAIVAGTISMAQQLGLHVVAEGVEHDDQLALLRTLQCESAQGFLFAEPLDAASAAERLTAGLSPRQESSPDGNTVSPGREDLERPRSRRQLPAAGRALLGAVAVVTVLTTAGVVALFKWRTPNANPSAGARQDLPLNPQQHPAGAPLASPPSERRSVTRAVEPAARTVAAPRRSFDVVHLHRVGSCRGHLLVSRDGVAFVPVGKTPDDAFTLKHEEFVQVLSGNTLTVKSATKTYRLTVPGASAKDAKESPLAEIVATIARSRAR